MNDKQEKKFCPKLVIPLFLKNELKKCAIKIKLKLLRFPPEITCIYTNIKFFWGVFSDELVHFGGFNLTITRNKSLTEFASNYILQSPIFHFFSLSSVMSLDSGNYVSWYLDKLNCLQL